MIHDTIIVGGGSAGCVLANRLSARGTHRVLLIEAGPDTPPGRVPEDVLDSFPGRAYFSPAYNWTDLRVHLQPLPHNEPRPPAERGYEQGRIMGGGSSINGQIALRGDPADYDRWQAMGARGWNWEGVLPYFKKLERDMDFDGPHHNKEGRIPIRRLFPEVWSGQSRAAAEAFAAAGYEYHPDMNEDFVEGYAPVPFSNAYDRRVSAAIGYLDPVTRQRDNLTLMPETRVKGLAFEGRKVVGVEVANTDGSGGEVHRAAQVILSSGALHSPAFLLRAGIGPAAHLRGLGIEVLADLPGVGQNLCEHPITAVSSYLAREARLDPRTPRHIQVNLRYSSGLEGCPPVDMQVNTIQRSAWHPLGKRLGTFQIWVNKPFSRGQVTLNTSDWRAEPEVEFNLLSDRRDLDRLMAGMGFLAELMEHDGLKRCLLDPFPSSYSERVRNVNKVSFKNWLATGFLSTLMGGPGPLRRFLVKNVITQGDTLKGLMADDGALEAFIRKTVTGIWHASCTCRMGAPDDPLAVTDEAGRVRGVEGLRVVDASVMPEVTACNTNIPTIMIAEKMADAIGAD
ncbi:MAG: GMC family oxidoreductase N-terminal domain-containing protein [Rhodospirillales bacterium]|jgi:5-(hydroxymethyl)furfural/furfural oxidase|nr:GMC family oxidoreductase N-terminal domain-containing protein [Rhodospirillales bacterium]MDP6884505.1 GMC family oxidoreductase N-terminal domain-containing protein [Rhodospirillales bacterium]